MPATVIPLQKRTAWEIQRAVLFALVLREFRTRIGRHWTGVVWTFFEPLAQVLLIVTVFGYLRHVASSGMEFPVFLLAGLMPYYLFQHLAQRLTDAADQNRPLFSYRQVKPFDTMVARGIVETLLWLAVLVASLALMQWYGLHALPQQPLELASVAALCALLGGSLGMLIAVSTHGYPRVRKAIAMVYFPLYLGSGVLFAINSLSQTYQKWLLWNPVLHLVELARLSFDPHHRMPAGIGFAYPAAVTLAIAAVALTLYRRDPQRLLREVKA
jgi:capsular polysaccharide transport system permease protein